MSASKKTSAGLVLVVIIAMSLVMSTLILFSAESIVRKTDDLSVRMEVTGEKMITAGQKGDIIAMADPIVDMLQRTVSSGENEHMPMSEGEKSWSMLADSPSDWKTMNATKAVIIVFDDGWKSQYDVAIPILDNHGFKATFFVVCDYVGRDAYMTWRQIRDLHRSEQDIQSHSMTHSDLTKLSSEQLDYELGQSKQCLRERGIESNIFATPFNRGWNNATVIEAISKYYEIAKNGNDSFMYLQCDGWKKVSNQTDCRPFTENAEDNSKGLTYANRYSIRSLNHNFYDDLYDHNDVQIFEKFVEAVNAPYRIDPANPTVASPSSIVVLAYHKIDDEKTATSTSPALFEAEMRYLHDNGFSVLTMNDLRYDEKTNRLFLSQD